MIVKDLRNSFNPVPKPGQKKTKQDRKKVKDFCIMPINNSYSTVRTEVYCERHEVYFSKAYRQKSIDDGLIVFLKSMDKLLQQNKRRIYSQIWQKLFINGGKEYETR